MIEPKQELRQEQKMNDYDYNAGLIIIGDVSELKIGTKTRANNKNLDFGKVKFNYFNYLKIEKTLFYSC